MLLEIISGGSDVLRAAFSAQRRELKRHIEVVTVESRSGRLSIDVANEAPKAVLIRGADHVDRLLPKIGKLPFFVDHCTPLEIGATSYLRDSLRRARRVYCYSQESDSGLRRAGTRFVTAIDGPTLPTDREYESSSVPVVGVLEQCSKSLQVLARLAKIRDAQGWVFDIVSPMRSSKGAQLANNFEVAEAADLIVSPYEDKDFGQPHEGAILALSLGRPLVTARTGAFNLLGFPADRLIPAKKHQIGSYAAAVGTYLRRRAEYDVGDWREGPSPLELPLDLLSRI